MVSLPNADAPLDTPEQSPDRRFPRPMLWARFKRWLHLMGCLAFDCTSQHHQAVDWFAPASKDRRMIIACSCGKEW